MLCETRVPGRAETCRIGGDQQGRRHSPPPRTSPRPGERWRGWTNEELESFKASAANRLTLLLLVCAALGWGVVVAEGEGQEPRRAEMLTAVHRWLKDAELAADQGRGSEAVSSSIALFTSSSIEARRSSSAMRWTMRSWSSARKQRSLTSSMTQAAFASRSAAARWPMQSLRPSSRR